MWKWDIKLGFISNRKERVAENIWDCHWTGNKGTIDSS